MVILMVMMDSSEARGCIMGFCSCRKSLMCCGDDEKIKRPRRLGRYPTLSPCQGSYLIGA